MLELSNALEALSRVSAIERRTWRIWNFANWKLDSKLNSKLNFSELVAHKHREFMCALNLLSASSGAVLPESKFWTPKSHSNSHPNSYSSLYPNFHSNFHLRHQPTIRLANWTFRNSSSWTSMLSTCLRLSGALKPRSFIKLTWSHFIAINFRVCSC